MMSMKLSHKKQMRWKHSLFATNIRSTWGRLKPLNIVKCSFRLTLKDAAIAANKMTKKNFKGIAEILSQFAPFNAENALLNDVINDLCTYFEQVNPKFNKQKFMEACGYEME